MSSIPSNTNTIPSLTFRIAGRRILVATTTDRYGKTTVAENGKPDSGWVKKTTESAQSRLNIEDVTTDASSTDQSTQRTFNIGGVTKNESSTDTERRTWVQSLGDKARNLFTTPNFKEQAGQATQTRRAQESAHPGITHEIQGVKAGSALALQLLGATPVSVVSKLMQALGMDETTFGQLVAHSVAVGVTSLAVTTPTGLFIAALSTLGGEALCAGVQCITSKDSQAQILLDTVAKESLGIAMQVAVGNNRDSAEKPMPTISEGAENYQQLGNTVVSKAQDFFACYGLDTTVVAVSTLVGGPTTGALVLGTVLVVKNINVVNAASIGERRDVGNQRQNSTFTGPSGFGTKVVPFESNSGSQIMVLANSGNGTVFILPTEGGSQLITNASPTGGARISGADIKIVSAAIVDWNMDGKPDVAVACVDGMRIVPGPVYGEVNLATVIPLPNTAGQGAIITPVVVANEPNCVALSSPDGRVFIHSPSGVKFEIPPGKSSLITGISQAGHYIGIGNRVSGNFSGEFSIYSIEGGISTLVASITGTGPVRLGASVSAHNDIFGVGSTTFGTGGGFILFDTTGVEVDRINGPIAGGQFGGSSANGPNGFFVADIRNGAVYELPLDANGKFPTSLGAPSSNGTKASYGASIASGENAFFIGDPLSGKVHKVPYPSGSNPTSDSSSSSKQAVILASIFGGGASLLGIAKLVHYFRNRPANQAAVEYEERMNRVPMENVQDLMNHFANQNNVEYEERMNRVPMENVSDLNNPLANHATVKETSFGQREDGYANPRALTLASASNLDNTLYEATGPSDFYAAFTGISKNPETGTESPADTLRRGNQSSNLVVAASETVKETSFGQREDGYANPRALTLASASNLDNTLYEATGPNGFYATGNFETPTEQFGGTLRRGNQSTYGTTGPNGFYAVVRGGDEYERPEKLTSEYADILNRRGECPDGYTLLNLPNEVSPYANPA
ncbi:MAG: VCBS repeat-containing protein [Candidatus Margulisbacteria bacterium]|nr:VCBS repeat-containing protein [Candidatus Margulisiibacteriota bacterium]